MSASRRSFIVSAAATLVPVAADAQEHASGHAHHGAGPADAFTAEMHDRMRAMMAAMDEAPMSGDPDRDFLAMMVPHHQGAVEMARLVLVHGRDPLTRQLAEEIIASQQAEISSMRARLRVLESGGASNGSDFPALTGTRGERSR